MRLFSQFFATAAIWLSLHVPAAFAMSFEADRFCAKETDCVEALMAKGTIDDKTPAAFDEAMARYPDTQAVVLSSKGGSLVGGLRLGLQIRRFQMDTIANDDCFSACAYAFLGGVARSVTPDGRIGVHQFRAGNRDLDAGNVQKITAVLGSYFDRMGIDRRLLDTAMLTPTSQVVVFNQEQLSALRAVNTGNVFPAWQSETTRQGQKVALWQNLYPDPDVKSALTVGIAKLAGAQRLMIIVRSGSNMNAFNGAMPLKLQLNGQNWQLQPVTEWSPVTKGMQISYTIPQSVINALLSGTYQEMRLLGQWPGVSQGVQTTALRVGLRQIGTALKSLD